MLFCDDCLIVICLLFCCMMDVAGSLSVVCCLLFVDRVIIHWRVLFEVCLLSVVARCVLFVDCRALCVARCALSVGVFGLFVVCC